MKTTEDTSKVLNTSHLVPVAGNCKKKKDNKLEQYNNTKKIKINDNVKHVNKDIIPMVLGRGGQNIYDVEKFFDGYTNQVTHVDFNPYNDGVEHPCMVRLIDMPHPPFRRTLDLGAGAGRIGIFLLQNNISNFVVFLDPSERMLQLATKRLKKLTLLHRADIQRCCIESFSAPEQTFDAIVSSLAVHYIEDFSKLCCKIYTMLSPGGVFIFSTEHPMRTCVQGATTHKVYVDGVRRYIVDSYHDEGIRSHQWFVPGVIRFHRTMSSLVMGLINAGFNIEVMEEPVTAPEFANRKDKDTLSERNPIFVAFRARKPHTQIEKKKNTT